MLHEYPKPLLNHGEYKLLNTIRYHMNYIPFIWEKKLIKQLIIKGLIIIFEDGSVQINHQ